MSNNQSSITGGRRFEFTSDTFAFANELLWEYQFDGATGQANFRRRTPAPAYAHRCFVLVRAARQFRYHARFDNQLESTSEANYLRLIRQIVARNPRIPCPLEEQIVIPGFPNLREFSAAREKLLKTACGGAWQSYILRSHWRMVLPISRAHQTRTAEKLVVALEQTLSPIVHLVTFPALTINHGMILFDLAASNASFEFSCYDPNNPKSPVKLTFDRHLQTFFLPANSYWAGGRLNVIQIYQNWLM